ncbi:MAG: site-specific DNA-methyltransferase, partial [Leptospiraceae bacterium]|nr:site-specific DNA-methyltransferase [Leptospiraceae bacterium]
KWLCMMYPRLKLLHKLLADDGVIFISIDDNEQANLKLIMDEIFGFGNFLSTLFWRGMHTVRNSSKDFNKNIEYVIVYTKKLSSLIVGSDPNYYLRTPQDKTEKYPFDDNDGKGRYKLDPIYARNYYKPYEYTFQNGLKWSPPRGNYPRYSVERLRDMDLKEQIIFTGKEPKAKRYLNEVQQGVPPSTLLEPGIVGFNKDATLLLNKIFSGEKVFDQPKPPSLIEFFLSIQRKVDTNDSIVLDSFAGSGTTAHAVLNLNKQDGGNRKFILIEMEEYAERITSERVKKVISGFSETEGTGGSFDFYKLGQPLFNKDKNLNETVTLGKSDNTFRF